MASGYYTAISLKYLLEVKSSFIPPNKSNYLIDIFEIFLKENENE